MDGANFLECDQKFEDILETYVSYSGDEETEILRSAYQLAKEAHLTQKRATGEPYLVHPLATAEIMTELRVDKETLTAAILHDTVEDTEVTYDELKEKFGASIADLVDGVTKLSRITYSSREEMQAENFRKMFLAMAEDIRVVLIKLADRMHNMRTMKYKQPERQIEKAQEALDIYAPLAHRLGIYKMKWELEDLSLRFLEPEVYYELVAAIAQKRSERERFLEDIVVELNTKIAGMGIEAEIEGRPKHFYSIYRKMKKQMKPLEEIYDLFACRVLVPTVGDCYAVLGLVHELYTPMPGRFKDYIAMPKPNMYQSLHTTVIGSKGTPFEVQIRTHEMHRIAEYGIAAHWKYKEGKEGKNKNEDLENKLTWLRQLLEWSQDLHDAGEYLANIKTSLIEDEVFVFTPRGDVIALPAGSVPIDFAYHIHSDIGNSMYGAKVNGHMVPMNYKLINGDIVDILRSDKIRGPSRDWLNIVQSNTARNKISSWFKKAMREENIVRGKDILDREIKKSGFTAAQLMRKEALEKILQRYSLNHLDDLYAGIGYGGVSAGRVIPKLRDSYLKELTDEQRAQLGYRLNQSGAPVYSPNTVLSREALMKEEAPQLLHEERKKKKKTSSGITVRGIGNCLIHLAKCCSPVPGDPIIGYITRGSGVTVHRTDCSNIRHIIEVSKRSAEDAERASRLVDVSWGDKDEEKQFEVTLTIIARDRTHLLADISNVIAEEKIPIVSGRIQSARDYAATLIMVVQISNQLQLEHLIRRIKSIEGVTSVQR